MRPWLFSEREREATKAFEQWTKFAPGVRNERRARQAFRAGFHMGVAAVKRDDRATREGGES